METLVREPLKKLELVDIDMAEKVLATAAAREFCYVGLLRRVERKEEQSKKVDVSEQFKKLGLEPFTNESVLKYKEEMLREANRLVTNKVLEWFVSSKGGGALFGASVAGALLGAILPVGINTVGHFHYHWWSFSLTYLSAFVAIGTLIVVHYAFGRKLKKFSWEMESLANYEREVPTFALSKALEIRKEIPHSYFYVDSLVSTEHQLDPFLVLEVLGVKYYIEVWDEPKFEGRRVK